MAGGIDGQPGGILAVSAELSEHGEAIEYDLIRMGLRLADLGTLALSWRDLLVIIRQAPPESAYVRSVRGEDSQWQLTQQLLASIKDSVEMGNWQRANAGRKAPTPRPKPIPRPGIRNDKGRVGSGAIPIKDFDKWWNEGATGQGPALSQPGTPHLSELLAGGEWQGELPRQPH